MIILELGIGPKSLSLNEERSLHWGERNRRLHPWRDIAWATALATGLRRRVDRRPCTITVHIPVEGNRRRDPANYYPVAKAAIDGLILAKVWPDDTPEWVTVAEPVLHVGATTASIHLEPRETP